MGDYKVSIEEDLTVEEAERYLSQAEDYWNTITAGPDGQKLESRISLSLELESEEHFHLRSCPGNVCDGTFGMAQRGGRVHLLASGRRFDTAGHEFGHSFGLGHQPPMTRSIMSTHYDRSVQYEDIRRLVEVYGK